MKIKNIIRYLVIGLFMGAANIIPGVSGGTIALITGIYDKLIHSINKIPKDIPLSALKMDRDGLRTRWKDVDYKFLGPIFIGALLAVVSIARGLEFLLGSHPAPTYALFFGLIAGSVLVIYKYIDRIDLKVMFSVILGIIAITIILSLDYLTGVHHPVMIFFGGMLSIVSMLLPGLSGSYILIMIGQYNYMLDIIAPTWSWYDIFLIIIFILGGIVGLFSLAKLLDYLLDNFRGVTIAFLFGLMLGALREPLSRAVGEASNSFEIFIPAIVGTVAIIFLEYMYLSRSEI